MHPLIASIRHRNCRTCSWQNSEIKTNPRRIRGIDLRTMTEVHTVKDQSLTWAHLDRLIVFCSNFIFNPKTVITPYVC